jgi:cell division protein FtsI (penicillin-binding protein 3)/stage V sporulation protein D (sporulation-specific penicillin-binding protein)
MYPNGEMLSHVLGFVNHEHKGVQGIESVMDDYLRGHNGFRFIEHDRTGREIVPYRGQERPPRNGCNVRLTVDMGLQNIVETELNEAVKQLKPEWATVILMNPRTGEILALANRPNFDLNDLGDAEPKQMKNRAVIDMYEPGSVFKIVGAAGALNEGIVRSDTMIFCENGRFKYGGRILRDHHGYGTISVEQTLVKSSNIGAAKLALQLGDQRFYEYVRRFGFGERTGISLPGEIRGVVHPPHRWNKISITRMPMGHEIGVTPLQIATSMAVIANGGNLVIPQIVREISDEEGNIVTRFSPVVVRRVVARTVAEKVRDALVGVVSEKGTAALAKVAGFNVAGKTGTAQKVKPEGGYYDSKYVVSFVGFMPAEDPAFVCLVVIDDAKTPAGQNYGGLVAAPIFSRIAERAARYLNLEPQPEEAPEKNFILTQSEDN